jgi:hypothetical protein
VALAAIAGVLVLSLLFDAPMGQPANPGLSPNPTKAPWYFAGIQELLMHFHPSFAWMIAAALTFGTFYLPYLNYREAPAGVWFASTTGRRTALLAALAAAAATPLAVVLDEYAVDFSAMMPGWPQAFSLGARPDGPLHCGRRRVAPSDGEKVSGVAPGVGPGCSCFSGRGVGDIDRHLRVLQGAGHEAARPF